MPKTITYWILTVLVCLAMGFGGVMDLVQPGDMKEQLKQMQMPLYFFSILGFWKVLGCCLAHSEVPDVEGVGLCRVHVQSDRGFRLSLLRRA